MTTVGVVAAFSTGAALLLFAAVIISQIVVVPPSLTATVFCSDPANPCTESKSITGGSISITANPGVVSSGALTTIQWSGEGVVDIFPPLTCFGNGTTCANTTL